jgi:hypothetical protein
MPAISTHSANRIKFAKAFRTIEKARGYIEAQSLEHVEAAPPRPASDLDKEISPFESCLVNTDNPAKRATLSIRLRKRKDGCPLIATWAHMVVCNEFRSDLYYRLNVFPIPIPPLRERRDDVPQLVLHFVEVFSRRMGKRIEQIPETTLDAFSTYHWPGMCENSRTWLNAL